MSSVVVNESLVRRILEDDELKNIGCLKDKKVEMPRKTGGGCGKCGKRKRLAQYVTTSPSLTWCKRCLYGMPEAALGKIKAKLSVERLVFYFNEPGLPQRIVR